MAYFPEGTFVQPYFPAGSFFAPEFVPPAAGSYWNKSYWSDQAFENRYWEQSEPPVVEPEEPTVPVYVSDYLDLRKHNIKTPYESVGETLDASYATPPLKDHVSALAAPVQKPAPPPAPTLAATPEVARPAPPEPAPAAPQMPSQPQVDLEALMQFAAQQRQAEEMARQQRIASALQNWTPPQVSPQQRRAAINQVVRNMLPARYR